MNATKLGHRLNRVLLIVVVLVPIVLGSTQPEWSGVLSALGDTLSTLGSMWLAGVQRVLPLTT